MIALASGSDRKLCRISDVTKRMGMRRGRNGRREFFSKKEKRKKWILRRPDPPLQRAHSINLKLIMMLKLVHVTSGTVLPAPVGVGARHRPCMGGPNSYPARRAHRAASTSRDYSSELPDSDALAAEFARLVNESGGAPPQRGPSHLLSPPAAIAAVMDALQRKDWPDQNAGLQVAYEFTKPQPPADPLAPSPLSAARRRSWEGAERWLDLAEFSTQVQSAPYKVLLECDDWRAAGALQFPSTRNEAKAVQAVAVEARGRAFTFTFCLELAAAGSLKGCWVVAGVRQGDYSV